MVTETWHKASLELSGWTSGQQVEVRHKKAQMVRDMAVMCPDGSQRDGAGIFKSVRIHMSYMKSDRQGQEQQGSLSPLPSSPGTVGPAPPSHSVPALELSYSGTLRPKQLRAEKGHLAYTSSSFFYY